MALNTCRFCGHHWHPRGAPKSAKCPKCGRTDGVELAVVQSQTGSQDALEDARRDGYNEKTTQIRWLLLGLAIFVIVVMTASGAWVIDDFWSEPPAQTRTRGR
ncbi:MAG: hypothetical protein ACOZNI_27235 [Myxococcota bacterium]